MDFHCENCGHVLASKAPRCPRCQLFGTCVSKNDGQSAPLPLSRVKSPKVPRIKFKGPLSFLNELLGGGMVPGCIYLLSGNPGAGKSTLAAQIASNFDRPYYGTSEETGDAIKRRVKRIGGTYAGFLVWEKDELESVLNADVDCDLRILDSLQQYYLESVNSTPGSVVQCIECMRQIVEITQIEFGITLVLAQINKAESVAGPVAVEHMVDCTLHLDFDEVSGLRTLRVKKNRHGEAPKSVALHMTETGLSPLIREVS